jgi:hypothetical protein
LTNKVQARAHNIERSKELSNYAQAYNSATRSQLDHDWSDDESIGVPRQDDDTQQMNIELDRAFGQDNEYSGISTGPVTDALPMADGGLHNDRYVALFDRTSARLTLHLSRHTRLSDVDPITGNKRVRSVTPEGQVAHVRKTKKVTNHKGRICANDFSPVVTAVINKACGLYRCMISTEDAFPSYAKELGFAHRAWKSACVSIVVDVQPVPSALKVVSMFRRGELLLKNPTDHATRLSDAWRGQDQNPPAYHSQL